jgi:hypothetical protein|tara:strand:- start:48 stop:239 length:192 start_codon:yes stop_codon:yes gene_type:complete
MTFAWHHPSYYRKLKQNSRRPKIVPSMNNASEQTFTPTMEAKNVGGVSVSSSLTLQPKGKIIK